MTNPSSWAGSKTSLIAKNRDSHVLVSAQACFLPIPANGKAIFNPTLYNYQSVPGDPAVLAILCSSEGASATILGRFVDSLLVLNQKDLLIMENCTLTKMVKKPASLGKD